VLEAALEVKPLVDVAVAVVVLSVTDLGSPFAERTLAAVTRKAIEIDEP
jgi:hypothetical protein